MISDQELETALVELKQSLECLPENAKFARAAIHKQISVFSNERKRRGEASQPSDVHKITELARSSPFSPEQWIAQFQAEIQFYTQELNNCREWDSQRRAMFQAKIDERNGWIEMQQKKIAERDAKANAS